MSHIRLDQASFIVPQGHIHLVTSHQILTVMVTNTACTVQHFTAYIVLACIKPVHYWISLYALDRLGYAARIERHQFTFNNMQDSPLILHYRPHQ